MRIPTKTKNLFYVLILCSGLSPTLGYASLGGDSQSVVNDAKLLSSQPNHTDINANTNLSTIKTVSAKNYTVSSFKDKNGTSISEYSANGKVFAVSWIGSRVPNFEQIFGANGKKVKTATTEVGSSLSAVKLSNDDFKLRMSGVLGFYHGVAFIPSLVPVNFNIDNLG